MLPNLPTKLAKLHAVIFLLTLMMGCMHSGTPVASVDASWAASKCTLWSHRQACSTMTNCTNTGFNVCRCTFSDDSYFVGTMKNNKSWCGVSQRGSNSFLVINGKATTQKTGVDWASTAILVVGVAAAAAIVSEGGGGGAPAEDYDWDWDAFDDQYGYLQWRCRGIQTGRFADNSKCLYDIKDDNRWPGR